MNISKILRLCLQQPFTSPWALFPFPTTSRNSEEVMPTLSNGTVLREFKCHIYLPFCSGGANQHQSSQKNIHFTFVEECKTCLSKCNLQVILKRMTSPATKKSFIGFILPIKLLLVQMSALPLLLFAQPFCHLNTSRAF